MRNVLLSIPLIALMCCLWGCQDQAAMAELEEIRAQAEIEEQNVALVKHLYEEMNNGNIGIFNDVFASDFAYISPSDSAESMSSEELAQRLGYIYSVFPDWRYEIQEIFAKGDKVAVRFKTEATHQNEFMGNPPTGNHIEYGSIAIFKIKDGKAEYVRKDIDMLGFYQQLGMELTPAAVEE